MTRLTFEDLPDHLQLKIYELVPPGCRPSAEKAVSCFQEIARQRAQQRAQQLGPAAPSGEVSERERVAVDRARGRLPCIVECVHSGHGGWTIRVERTGACH